MGYNSVADIMGLFSFI